MSTGFLAIFYFKNQTPMWALDKQAKLVLLKKSFRRDIRILSSKIQRVSQRGVGLRAVVVNFGFSKLFREIDRWALVSQRYSVKKIVWLLAVLVIAESDSLILRKSPRNRIFQQNHFSLFFRGPVGLESWKNANLVTLPL